VVLSEPLIGVRVDTTVRNHVQVSVADSMAAVGQIITIIIKQL